MNFRILSWFRAGRARKAAIAAAKLAADAANADFAKAQADYRAAISRGDTRGQNAAVKAMVAAQTMRLKLEARP